MNTVEIYNGNRLIYKYLGYSERMGRFVYPDGHGIVNDNTLTTLPGWEWLMFAVEKIEEGNFGFKMCRKVVEIYYDDTKKVILKTKEKCRLESLWQAIVQFIDYQNLNQSNSTPLNSSKSSSLI